MSNIRFKKEYVKTAKKRTLSSTLWLQRQLSDPYVHMSKQDGYRSRSAYKLIEINEKFNLLNKNSVVLDLGCSPGGWSQVASKITNKIIAVDLLEMPPIDGVDFIQSDFRDIDFTSFTEGKFDVILSDMAPNTSGCRESDHLKILAIAEETFDIAHMLLKPNGAVVVKIFQGGATNDLLCLVKKKFKKIKHFKPNASRKDSSEMYLVAQGFKIS